MKKKIFTSLCLIFFFVLLHTNQTQAADVIFGQKNILKQETIPGTSNVRTEYTDGSYMLAVPNPPNPPTMTYTTKEGTSYNVAPGTGVMSQIGPLQTQGPIPSNPFNNTFAAPNTNNIGTAAPQESTLFNSIIPSTLFGNSTDQPLNKLLNQIFYIGLVVAISLAIIMIIRGGVEYMTIDSITGKESGKSRIKAALGGLLLAFSAIMILNTINPGLTKLDITINRLENVESVILQLKNLGFTGDISPTAVSGWYRDSDGNLIKPQSDGSTLVSTPNGANYTLNPDGSLRQVGLVSPDGTPYPLLDGQDEESIRKYLADNGISINKAAGPANANGVTGGFTNVAGLGDAALKGLIDLKQAGYPIEVTGGTESGHATHGVGKSIVDISIRDSGLNSYITSNAVSQYPRGSYTEYKHANGTTFMNEGDHWHVEFR